MNLITHRVKTTTAEYVLTDYGRGTFGLANLHDNVHVWLNEQSYGEIMTAINDRNDPALACQTAENKALENLASVGNYFT